MTETSPATPLKVYLLDGSDWVIAYSAADAGAVYEEWCGDSWYATCGVHAVDVAVELPPDRIITVWDASGHEEILSAEAWVVQKGRCFLASANW